jgi:large subunit ribosomal protein L15
VPGQVVNLRELSKLEGTEVHCDSLLAAGLVRRRDRPIKILGNGEVTAKLRVSVQGVSAAARQKIEGAGGSVELIPVPRRRAASEETR